MTEAEDLRTFKTRARALPDEERRQAFKSDDFRRLVAGAATRPAASAVANCGSHCFSHCGSHCFGHTSTPSPGEVVASR
jgi:hypothetical protein